MKLHKANYSNNITSNTRRVISVFLILLILTLTGCGSAEEYSDTLKLIETGSSSDNEPDEVSLEYLDPYIDIDAEVSERLRNDCEEIAALCDELMSTGERENTQYYSYNTALTQGAVDKVEEHLAASGYPVINTDSVYPKYLDNSDGLKQFAESSESGQVSEQSIISVSMYDTIYYLTFQYDGAEMYYISTSITWDENGEYEISNSIKQKLIDWGMTYNGYFYYQLLELNRHWNACSYIRTQPVDKELYDLYIEYLSPANYPSSVFTKDWDSQSYSEICFNDLFESFYIARNGEYVYADDYERFADMSCSLIPASIFESTVLPYFDIDLDEFRALTLYMPDSDSYPWQELNCSNVIYCPCLTPEVTDKRDNEDGTFTVTVDVLCFDYKCFPRFTHEITIKPDNNGGFQYISNRVTYIDEHGVPETAPRLAAQRTTTD